MKIYFSGSISGGRADVEHYRRIVEALRARGHEVLAGEVINPDLGAAGESNPPAEIFERDLAWIEDAADDGGLLVAEVSHPSIGVGYEVAAARYRYGMPVICLWRPKYTKRCSAMVAGDGEIQLLVYEDGETEAMIERLCGILDLVANKRPARFV